MLGFLIDPNDGCAHIYRPGTTPQIPIKPDALSGDPELPRSGDRSHPDLVITPRSHGHYNSAVTF
jgi:hypothetical protein